MGIKLKVLNVLFTNSMGGPGRRVLSVARELRKYGIETVMLAPEERGDFVLEAIKEKFRVYKILLDRPRFITNFQSIIINILWLFRFFYSVILISKLIEIENIDIVHINGLLNLQASLAGFLKRRKIVWHLISSLYPKIVVLILMPYVKLVANQKVIVAKKMAKYYLLDLNNDDVSVIYEPVDLNKFNPANVPKNKVEMRTHFFKNVTFDDIIVGCVANLSSVKGYEFLIKSVNIIKKQGYNVKLIIVGGIVNGQTWYYKKLQELVFSLGMEKDVIFAGRRSNIPFILSLFDLFVLPSIAEGTPLAILEAMAMRLPIIATDVGGVSEQIVDGKTGLLVPPKNPRKIAEAIIFLINNPEYAANIGKRARERVKRLFDLKRCVRQHKRLYDIVAQ